MISGAVRVFQDGTEWVRTIPFPLPQGTSAYVLALEPKARPEDQHLPIEVLDTAALVPELPLTRVYSKPDRKTLAPTVETVLAKATRLETDSGELALFTIASPLYRRRAHALKFVRALLAALQERAEPPFLLLVWLAPELFQQLRFGDLHASQRQRRPPVRPVPASPPLPVSGPLPLGSELYVKRAADRRVLDLLDGRLNLLQLIGPRQHGKTSLLIRLAAAAPPDWHAVLIDLQRFRRTELESSGAFLSRLLEGILEVYDLPVERLQALREGPGSAHAAAERLLREILTSGPGELLLLIDGVDRIHECDPGTARDVLLTFRGWQQWGVTDPVWHRLRVGLAFSAREYGLRDLGEGCTAVLDDFSPDQVLDLARQHEATPAQARELFEWVGGQPYLVQRCLEALGRRKLTIEDLCTSAVNLQGIMGEHLATLRDYLDESPPARQVAKDALQHDRLGQRPPPAVRRLLGGLGLLRLHEGELCSPDYKLYRETLSRKL